MTESVFERVERCSEILKLDFSSAELAYLIEEHAFSADAADAIAVVFEHLSAKKTEMTIQTILKMSRLPLKDPKTFETFDFSVIKGNIQSATGLSFSEELANNSSAF